MYSEAARAAALARGTSPPERCTQCRAQHRRETSRLGLAYIDLEPGRLVPATGLKAGRLGRIERPERPHTSEKTQPQPIGEDEFGIKDEHIRELLQGLETHQVAIVQAGTGSGKSTFLPWRLLVPPEPFERDHLTRHGQILVTQPRIDASTGIPEYVAQRLHGSRAGPGLDIGYRNSKATDMSDAANKLVYLTDGTLVNMIRRGEMHTVSTVVIDEAHERSLNIDLVLALLRREMRNLPQLRLLIVSATLDKNTFTQFFAPDYDVLFCPMPSKVIHPVYERWRAEEEIPFASWPRRMPDEVAVRAIEVLRWMILGERPGDIPESIPCHDGDILCFLPGKVPIKRAMEEIERLLSDDEEIAKLSSAIELLPLHAELPAKQRRRALGSSTRPKHVRWRVIVSTNLAETSLTIDGIRHVIDSGLNNLTSWDPLTAAAEIRPAPHSQSGLWQRRGRAGRNAPGVWHCLFTKGQFAQLEYETAAEITRAPLSAVLLNAATAGVSDPKSLRWLPPGPSEAELRRARVELRALGAITEAGDPTTFGREVSASRGEFNDSTILVNADFAGCVVEAATVLAMKARTLARRNLLRWNVTWPAAAKIHVDDVHTTLLEDCPDDLEMICRIIAAWEQQPQEARRVWCDRHYIDYDTVRALIIERTILLTGLQSKMKTEEVRPVDLALLPRLRAVIAWSSPNGVYSTERQADGGLVLTPIHTARSNTDVIAAMHDGARPVVDSRSWSYRQAPAYIVMLDRSRFTRWTSPLLPPETVQQGALCAAVDPQVLKESGTLLGILVDVGLGERTPPVSYLPGDRFLAHLDGWTVRLVEELEPIPDPTVELGADDDEDDAWPEAPLFAGAIVRGEEDDGGYGYVGAFDDEGEARRTPDQRPPDRQDTDLRQAPGGQRDRREADRRPATRGVGLQPSRDGVELPDAELGSYYGGTGLVEVRIIAASGAITVVPDRSTQEFQEFEAAHPVGSELTAQIQEVRVFPRDRRPLVVAKDDDTKQTVLIDGMRLGTGLRFMQTGQLRSGTMLQLTAEGYDHERLTAELGQVAATIGSLASLTMLSGTPRRAVVVTARIVDAQEGKLWVQISSDELSRLGADAPPLVLPIDSGYLPSMSEIIVGASVRVRIFWRRATSAWQKVAGLDQARLRLPPGPWELQPGQIVVNAAPTVADWRRILDYTAELPDPALAARLRLAVTRAARRILDPRIEVIDYVAIERMRDSGRAEAVVTAADERGVTVRLPHGGTQRIPANQVSWDGQPPSYEVGKSVTAFVTAAQPETGEVRVQLRDPKQNPLLRLSNGEIIQGTIVGRHQRYQRDFLVQIPEVTGIMRGFNSADFDIGDTLDVRVVEVRPEANSVELSAWIVDDVIQMPEDLEPLWRRSDTGKIDRRPLQRLVDDDVRIEIRDEEPSEVRVLSTNEEAGQIALSNIASVLSGSLYYVAVPGFAVVTADDSALLWEFAPDAAVALCRRQIPGRNGTVPALAVAIASEEAADWIVERLQQEYPEQWVSDWFRFEGAKWKAGREALRVGGLKVRVDLEKEGAYFKAVFSGEWSEIEEAQDLLRQYVAIPDAGTMQPDARIRVIQ